MKSWYWWNTYVGVGAVINLLDYFKKIQNGLISIGKENLNLINSFLNQLGKINSKKSNYTSVCVHASDFFYLNSKNFRAFHYLSSAFRQFNVFLEIAVPTILAGIEKEDNIYSINATYVWFKQIDMNIYDNLGYFAHPVKISQYYNTTNGAIFCDKFIKEKLMNF